MHKSVSNSCVPSMLEIPRPLILAVDQGTTSTRAILFSHDAEVVSMCQKEHTQVYPHPGWVEHDPMELWDACREVVGGALARGNANNTHIKAAGVTNQRETTVVWNKFTGAPVYNAIVWQDTRTLAAVRELEQHSNIDWRQRTGLPPATYFSGPKVKWILDNVPEARQEAEDGQLLFGTIDTWLIWNMTGGVHGGIHVTDVTNASRTMLMDLRTLDWDPELCEALAIPMSMLPKIKSSSGVVGLGRENGLLSNVPISGILGDQQAATFGQTCFSPGESKATFGTGTFLIANTGEKPIKSEHGLLTTVCYKIGREPAVYALEGSVAVSGSLIRWLRDQLNMIETAADVETLAATVEDSAGCVFIPAFGGLFAPWWCENARGMIHGLSFFHTKAHIARAALESAAFQTKDVVDAMAKDLGHPLKAMKVDGGMTANNILMQFQADILASNVVRSSVPETTALGAAFAAGLAVGFWKSLTELRKLYRPGQVWQPKMKLSTRNVLLSNWQKAVTRSCGWLEDVSTADDESSDATATPPPTNKLTDSARSSRERLMTDSTCYPEVKEQQI